MASTDATTTATPTTESPTTGTTTTESPTTEAPGSEPAPDPSAVMPGPTPPPVPLTVQDPGPSPDGAARPVVVYLPGGAGFSFPSDADFAAWAKPYTDAGYVAVMPRTDVDVLPAALDRDGDHQVDDPSVLSALPTAGAAYNPAMPLWSVLVDMALRSPDVSQPAYVCNPFRHDGVEPDRYPLPTGDVTCWLFLDQFLRTRRQVRDEVAWLGGPGADQLGIDPTRITVVGESYGGAVANDLAFTGAGLPHAPALVVTVAGSDPFVDEAPAGAQVSPVVLLEYADAAQPSVYRPADGLPAPDSAMVLRHARAVGGDVGFVQLAGSGHIPDPGTDAAACVQGVVVAGVAGGFGTEATDARLVAGCAPGAVASDQRVVTAG